MDIHKYIARQRMDRAFGIGLHAAWNALKKDPSTKRIYDCAISVIAEYIRDFERLQCSHQEFVIEQLRNPVNDPSQTVLKQTLAERAKAVERAEAAEKENASFRDELALLRSVRQSQAALIDRWQQIYPSFGAK